MRHGSLFSGIGCADLASEWMGWENIFQVEKDPYCQRVLSNRFPNTEKHFDIYNFNGSKYNGTIDILTGGFPCQKYSHAGFREGDEPLAKEMLRVIDEIQPGYVLAENVYGFFSIDAGVSLNAFCSDLQNLGYEKPVILDLASDFAGLQTMERHLWIISKADGLRFKRNEQIKVSRIGQNSRKFSGTSEGIRTGRDIRESRFCGVGERTSRRLDKFERERLKAIGNGFPPQVAFEIFKAIEQTHILNHL